MDRDYKDRTDAELLRDARSDNAAFDELFVRHAAVVHEQLRRRSPRLAADLTAETFAQAWLVRRKFRDERDGSALPWLLGIARNLLHQSIRADRAETRARERLGIRIGFTPEDEHPEVGDSGPTHSGLSEAWAQLGGHEREALELRVFDELPYAEVASRLSIGPTAARSRVHRALRRLAKALRPEDEQALVSPILRSRKGQI